MRDYEPFIFHSMKIIWFYAVHTYATCNGCHLFGLMPYWRFNTGNDSKGCLLFYFSLLIFSLCSFYFPKMILMLHHIDKNCYINPLCIEAAHLMFPGFFLVRLCRFWIFERSYRTSCNEIAVRKPFQKKGKQESCWPYHFIKNYSFLSLNINILSAFY